MSIIKMFAAIASSMVNGKYSVDITNYGCIGNWTINEIKMFYFLLNLLYDQRLSIKEIYYLLSSCF